MQHCCSHLLALAALAMGLASADPVRAATDRRPPELPYFASLKRPVANVRVGPGLVYPIRWIYRKRGVPVEVIAVFGNWRRIRSSDGQDGWVNQVLLSASRTALVSPWDNADVDLRARRGGAAPVVARLEPRVLVRLRSCDRSWCAVTLPGRDDEGYVRQSRLWGVYPDEIIKDRSFWGTVENML